MREEIIDIIIRLTEYDDLRNDTDINLIEEDILDSLAFIELINELEERYDIEIQPTQVPGDSWNSVDNIVGLVESLKKESTENLQWEDEPYNFNPQVRN
ncbi:MAG: D-alanine--poly(phosphoribitol) ligase subunit 2 [Lachnospiraceae bacterium]|nr:D-alanine--poly(phosphoribitol) ligase subunit 2 [Lachnospiraceae bacterium]